MRMMRMFGPSAGRRLGSTRFLYVESCIVSPGVEAEGVGGKGRTSCAPAGNATAVPSAKLRAASMVLAFTVFVCLFCGWLVCSLHFPRGGPKVSRHPGKKHSGRLMVGCGPMCIRQRAAHNPAIVLSKRVILTCGHYRAGPGRKQPRGDLEDGGGLWFAEREAPD